MNTLIIVLMPLVIAMVIFLVIYRSVPGKRSPQLKGIGWLELLIAYFCVFVPMGLLMQLGTMNAVSDKFPDLKLLSIIDFLLRLLLMLMSLYVGVCLWKTAKNAVKKAKFFLIALLVFNIVVARGIYNLAIFYTLASANINIPSVEVLNAFTKDIRGTIVITAVVVAWYIYLNKSKRVKDIYNIPSAPSIAEGIQRTN